MAKSFTVTIVTPEKTAFEAKAVSVILPGTEGYLGIWANHAPLVTGLNPGIVAIREDDTGSSAKTHYLAVTNGFVEVSQNNVSILCDTCEPAGEIDINRAKAALERAREKLFTAGSEADKERARQAAERAQARIRAVYLREGHRD